MLEPRGLVACKCAKSFIGRARTDDAQLSLLAATGQRRQLGQGTCCKWEICRLLRSYIGSLCRTGLSRPGALERDASGQAAALRFLARSGEGVEGLILAAWEMSSLPQHMRDPQTLQHPAYKRTLQTDEVPQTLSW